MSRELFRREVLEATQRRHQGDVSLAQPLQLRLLVGFAILAAATVVAFLLLGSYSRRSRVTGQLVPSLGLSTVVAPTGGVVVRLFSEEGDSVQAGASLAQINVPRATTDGKDAIAAVLRGLEVRDSSVATFGRSQVAQVDAQISGTRRQLEVAKLELRQVELAIATRREQVQLGRSTVERYRQIAAERFVSAVQVDQQEQSMLELVTQQQGLERQATTLRRGIAQLQQALRELPAQRAANVAIAQRDRAAIGQERVQHETSGELLVQAPVPGLIASLLIDAGQAVQAGQPLLSVLPKGSTLEAQLLVPSRAIGFVESGDSVLLRYDAYPYQKFGHHVGKVIRVSRSPVNPGHSAALASNGNVLEPHYRVVVELEAQTVTAYGKPEPLRPGMVVEADILSERRKLYEWLIEPLYSLNGKVTGDRRQTSGSTD
ncbi:HlyD family secretion protein [Lysobacter sp. TAF61]|uniref:HlyD family secretion protein n=1 Tax=Lysobacter sp. TAF61 TaxID=3233072 RepID=UPI003F96D69F